MIESVRISPDFTPVEFNYYTEIILYFSFFPVAFAWAKGDQLHPVLTLVLLKVIGLERRLSVKCYNGAVW
ncbi:MAG: hypothetical protein CL876_02725 [Dehalococcoidales bacterium]|nr:hypothetical protein [Dehalococcoidales bacterium]